MATVLRFVLETLFSPQLPELLHRKWLLITLKLASVLCTLDYYLSLPNNLINQQTPDQQTL